MTKHDQEKYEKNSTKSRELELRSGKRILHPYTVYSGSHKGRVKLNISYKYSQRSATNHIHTACSMNQPQQSAMIWDSGVEVYKVPNRPP